MNNKDRKEYLFRILRSKRCAECGSNQRLSFDHFKPRTYSLEHMTETQRLIQYIADAKQGLLQVLCIQCNSRKSRIAVNKGFRSQFVCKCTQCTDKKLKRKNKKIIFDSNKSDTYRYKVLNETLAGREASPFCRGEIRRGLK